MADVEWRSQVVKKLEAHIKDVAQLTEILIYLGQLEDAKGGCQNSSAWKTLRDLQSADRVVAFAERLLKEAEINKQSVRNCALEVYNKLKIEGTKAHSGRSMPLDIGTLTECGSVGFAYSWACIKPETQARILQILPHLGGGFAVELANKAGAVVKVLGKKAGIALAAVYLSYEAVKNIYRWYKGEISGERAAKNVVDLTATLGAGFGGGVAGAAVGGLFGPIGLVAGAVIGSFVASIGAAVLIDMLTQELFDIPKDEALEKAYKFLGVGRKATDEEVNKAFKSLCLKHHPDKGGSQQDFIQLQTCMAIIKVARGEKYE